MKRTLSCSIMLFATAFTACTGWALTNNVVIPGANNLAAYDIPPGGADLKLNINAAADYDIDTSGIRLQYNYDNVQWYRQSASSATHTYRIGTVFSSREYLWVTGTYHRVTGGGGGGPSPIPKFNAEVMSTDIDLSGVDEQDEETGGRAIAKGGSRHRLTIFKAEPRDQRSGYVVLSVIPENRVTVWDASSGGNQINLPASFRTPQDLPEDIWIQGSGASQNPLDTTLIGSYTANNRTARDKIKLTVVGVDMPDASKSIAWLSTNHIQVNVYPSGLNTNIELWVRSLGGQGSAIFLPSHAPYTTITSSTNIPLYGKTPSQTASNMIIRAYLDNDVCGSNIFTVVKMDTLHYRIGTNEWAEIPDPLYVAKGTTVDFRGMPYPTNAPWPDNRPLWGGQVSGSGAEKSFTFNTVYRVTSKDLRFKNLVLDVENVKPLRQFNPLKFYRK